MSVARAAIAAGVVVVMGVAILGIGVPDGPAEKEPAPSAAQVSAAKQRIAAGGQATREGAQAFKDEGCDRCHSIAAIGADGKLGPRLDTLDEDSDDIEESITDPRDDTADDYSEELMPTDYADSLNAQTIAALTALIAEASGTEDKGDDHSGEGGGRGRGRGRGGRGGGGEED